MCAFELPHHLARQHEGHDQIRLLGFAAVGASQPQVIGSDPGSQLHRALAVADGLLPVIHQVIDTAQDRIRLGIVWVGRIFCSAWIASSGRPTDNGSAADVAASSNEQTAQDQGRAVGPRRLECACWGRAKLLRRLLMIGSIRAGTATSLLCDDFHIRPVR